MEPDVNGDGSVDMRDLAMVAGRLGITAENRADVNGDGMVNVLDLALVAGMANDSTDSLPMFSDGEMAFRTTQVREWLEEARRLKPRAHGDSEGYRIFGASFGGVDTGTDGVAAELPESLQSGDLDPVSTRAGFACANLDL